MEKESRGFKVFHVVPAVHAVNPDIFRGKNLPAFPHAYQMVAFVTAENVEGAYRATNSVNGYWGNNLEVDIENRYPVSKGGPKVPNRSTSVGDVIADVTDEMNGPVFFRVMPYGFELLNQAA